MNEKDLLLTELVHYLAYGTRASRGLSLRETKKFLNAKLSHKNGKTVHECLELEGSQFLNELKTFINELEIYVSKK